MERPEIIEDLLPEEEPVTPTRFAYYAKIDAALGAEEGLLVGDLLKEAREYCEEYLQRSLGPKTLRTTISRSQWRGKHELPYGPNITILEVTNEDGDTVPLDTFGSTYNAEYLKGMSVNNTFKEDYEYWYADPNVYEEAFTITYTAGYAVGKVPGPIKRAIAKVALELYANRENSVIGTIVADLPLGVKELLNPYRAKVLL